MRIENLDLRSSGATNRRAVAGLLLAIPFTVILLTATLNIDPINGLMTAGFISQGSITTIGSIVVIGSLGLIVAAFMLNAMVVWRGFAAGRGITAYPFCMAVMIVMAGYIAFLLASFVIDQYPCWIDVPNCD